MADNLDPEAAASAGMETPPVSTGQEASGVPGTPPEGSGGASPAPAAESQGIRQLREAYENLKKTYEPYEKLGKPEEIQSRIATYQKIESAALDLGSELGYSEEDIRQALQNDAAGTLAFLRSKQAEGAQNQNPEVMALRKELADIKKSIDPLRQSEEQRKMDSARNLFDSAVNAAIKSIYKDEQLSEDEIDAIWEDSLQLMKSDKEAINRLVNEGKTSDVVRFVTKARERSDKAYLARVNRERKSGNTGAQGTQETTEAKLSIDDIIHGRIPKGHPLNQTFNP
jgi:hypothetical protein